MAATKVKATTVSKDELTASVDALLDQMASGDDKYWQAYADRLAHEVAAGFKLGMFKTWSANNRFYLAAQARSRPNQVQGLYAGVDQWRKRNRVVREGEKPFIIYGPPTFIIRQKPATQAQQSQATPAGNPATVKNQAAQQAQTPPAPAPQYGYRRPPIIEVYDYTQTVSTDPDYVEPDWSVPLAGGDLATLARMVEISPVPVKFAELGSMVEHGWLDHDGITIDASRSVMEQIWTLSHELAHHHLGHLDKIASTRKADERDAVRAKCEQEAGFAQYLTLRMLGLDESVGVDITAAAGQYLRHWFKANEDGTETPIAGYKGRRKLLKARFDAGLKAAQAIVSAYANEDITVETPAKAVKA